VKGVRILQVVLLVLAALYLVLFNNLNPEPVNLPLLLLVPVAPVFVVLAALIGGWLIGWLPPRLELWRRGREIRRLRQRLADLEQSSSRHEAPDTLTPVIPDRLPFRHERDDEASSL